MAIQYNTAGKLAVIGSPIEHSLSPLMHNFMIKKLSLNYIYLPYHIKNGDFKKFLDSANFLNITGFNCTMPHKQDAFLNVDEVFEDALKSKSVNTVNFKNGKWSGYSTDGDGFYLSLKEKNATFKDKNILLIGAGGAARALVVTAFKYGAKNLVVLNRTLDKANDIISDFKNASALLLDNENLISTFKSSDIIINCTPLGMSGVKNDFENFDFISKGDKIVCDLIYNPVETNFLSHARKNGHQTLNGLSMLIYQGILSLEIFTNTKIDAFEMKKELEKVLCMK